MNFTLDGFVADARQAAASVDPLVAADRLMAQTFANPDRLVTAIAPMVDDEVLLFEDDSVSVWHERFLPDEELPPHDHQLPAIIGVYHGQERNRLFRQSGDVLVPAGSLTLSPGDTYVFGPHDVHTVQALGGSPSLGLHIYLGPLTKVERSLFGWENGQALPMSDDAFHAMKRPV